MLHNLCLVIGLSSVAAFYLERLVTYVKDKRDFQRAVDDEYEFFHPINKHAIIDEISREIFGKVYLNR